LIYPYLLKHIEEVEKWTLIILEDHPEADKETVLLSVWLHDIGHTFGDKQIDHAEKSAYETLEFLDQMGASREKIINVTHCVRSHRCKDVIPNSLEAKILATADSASHLTDVNYIIHAQEGDLEYAKGKIRRDLRDIEQFQLLNPKLLEQLQNIGRGWETILANWPFVDTQPFTN